MILKLEEKDAIMEVDFHARVTEYQSAFRKLLLVKGEKPDNKVRPCFYRRGGDKALGGTSQKTKWHRHQRGCAVPWTVVMGRLSQLKGSPGNKHRYR